MSNLVHIAVPIKVARVSTVAFFVDTQLHAQISAIVRSGAQVTVVASEDKLSRQIPGCRYVSIEIPRKIDLIRDLEALFHLWRLIRRSGFDIVHSTTPKAGLLCALAGWLAGVPVRLHTFTGQAWVGLTGVQRLLSKSSDKLVASLNTHCYADSASQREFILANSISRPEQVSVLGSGSLAGIDLERFDPSRFSADDGDRLRAELGIRREARVLLFVGRLARDKGIAELLHAFQAVSATGIDASLILLGPPEADFCPLLAALGEEIARKIVMPGFAEDPERFMAISDILLLPSYREGFGTVVIEAAAMGLPAIGTDIYGLSDAIVDGVTGLLVPVKNAEKLAEAISALLHDDATRCRLGAAARQRVESEFSSQRISSLLLDDYVRLATENRAAK